MKSPKPRSAASWLGLQAAFWLLALCLGCKGVSWNFVPPELLPLIILALVISTYLAHGSQVKALLMSCLGIFLSQIGMDIVTGKNRFTLGMIDLSNGVGLVPLVMGLFGIAEVFINLEQSGELKIYTEKISGILPDRNDWRDSIGPIMRGTMIGFFLGILPGGGAIVASFVSYSVEKRISNHPEKFGKGAIEGVAGPESANNSGSSGAFIPLFALGIPSNAVMALLLGALMIHGLQPGPLLLKENPKIFWGTIVSMYIGNLILLVLNLPLIGIWIKLLKVPYRILYPFILFFCIIGSYTINSNMFDVLAMLFFGVLGYGFKKFGYEPAPLIMAFILGDLLENSFRQSLLISGGSFAIFLERPIAVACLGITALLFATTLVPGIKKRLKKLENLEVT